MKIYKVGGAIRDELLGLVPRDHDFLVIDSSPEEMKKLGFLQVGSSYEVFLHPQTRNEYVLAQDLKEDLGRRDLTINAMAKDEEGNLIDFFDGRSDLEKKIFRHTSHQFAEDSLRLYRLARFTSQYPDFIIAPETLELCRSLVKTEEFRSLNGERIFGELKDALAGKSPEAFFSTLSSMDALNEHLAMIRQWTGLNEQSLKKSEPLHLFAFLVRLNTQDEISQLGKRLLIQNDWLEAGRAACRVYSILPRFKMMNQVDIINLFYELDAFRKPDLIQLIAELFSEEGKQLKGYFEQVKSVSRKDVDPDLAGKNIGEAIKHERIRLLTL